jgi:hypothetical protein
MSDNRRSDGLPVRWLPAVNVSGDDIPPFGVVRLVKFNADGQFEVGYPNKHSYPYGLAFNGPTTMAKGETGKVTIEMPYWARYDSTVKLAVGDECGPVINSFSLSASKDGFRALSAPTDFKLDAVMVTILGGVGGDTIEIDIAECVSFIDDTPPPPPE